MKNNKGVSAIIGAVIMIALVLVLGGIVWGVVSTMVSEQLEEAGTCLEVLDKVEINNQYTCWDSDLSEFRFSINIKDIELQKIVVSISGAGETNSYELSSEINPDLSIWPSGGDAIIPEENSGKTYTANFTIKPDNIIIYPVIKGKQCSSADSLSSIDNCYSIA